MAERKKGWVGCHRGGGIGDDLIISSVFPLLREKYGHLEVITQKPQSDVFENNPFIDKLTLKPPEYIPGAGGLEWQKWFANRALEYDAFFNFSHSLETRLALVPGQTQFYWPDSWRRKYCGVSYLEYTHDICGVPYVFDPGPRFYSTEEEKADVANLKAKIGHRVVGVALGGSRLDKTHPLGPVMVARILRETDCAVLLFGSGARDYELAKTYDQHVLDANAEHSRLHLALTPGPIVEKPGTDDDVKRVAAREDTDWSIRRALSMAQSCDLLISPDTGLAWSCAMEDVPKIMLLSHASAENITKHWRNTVTLAAYPARVPCYPCHRLHDTTEFCHSNKTETGAACISDISVEAIVSTVKDLLNGTRERAIPPA